MEVMSNSLASGYLKTEVAYLADALSEAGISGDAARHRATTDTIDKLLGITNSGGSSKPLSPSYFQVKAKLLELVDSSLQKQPPSWLGIHAELEGIGLSRTESAQTLIGVLSKLEDVNVCEDLTALRKLQLYLELFAMEMSPELKLELSFHRLSFPSWSPVDLGSPKEGLQIINDLLKNEPNRMFWASALFSFAWGNPTPQVDENFKRDESLKRTRKWAQEFQSVAANTWMEKLANAYAKSDEYTNSLVLVSFFDSGSRERLGRLPAGFLFQFVAQRDLQDWLKKAPTKRDPVLSFSAGLLEEMLSEMDLGQLSRHFVRFGGVHYFGEEMLAAYPQNPEFYRPIYQDLKSAFAKTQEGGADKEGGRAEALKSLKKLLSQLGLKDN